MPDHDTISGISVLELTMRAVLDGMAEIANEYAFRDDGATFEIVAVEALEPERLPGRAQSVKSARWK